MREMTHFNYAHIKEEMKQIVKGNWHESPMMRILAIDNRKSNPLTNLKIGNNLAYCRFLVILSNALPFSVRLYFCFG